MSAEIMSEFMSPCGSFEGAFPDLDFTFSEERRAAGEWIKENSPYLAGMLSLGLIQADSAESAKLFSWTPTILGGIAGGIGGFLWELADGSSANKINGIRTNEGVAVIHQGSSFAELFVSTFGGILVGGSVGAGLTSGIDSKIAYALGLLGTIPGLTICRATKQSIWPLRK